MAVGFHYTIYDVAGSYTWTAPDSSVETVWADIMGAATGGCGTASYGGSGNAGGGGGGGEFIERALIPVVGGTLAVVVGAGTAGSPKAGAPTLPPADAGLSSVDNRIALGGRYRSVLAVNTYQGGYGGGVGGGTTTAGTTSPATKGNRESPLETGGWSGGGGGHRASAPSTTPLECPGSATEAQSGTTGGGGGGSTSPYGPGGTGGNDGTAHPGSSSTHNGAGGGGASSDSGTGAAGGTGADGKVIIYWMQAA